MKEGEVGHEGDWQGFCFFCCLFFFLCVMARGTCYRQQVRIAHQTVFGACAQMIASVTGP